MSDITDAVALVNQQARAFKAVIAVSDALRRVGDVETYLAKLNSDVASGEATLKQLQGQIEDVKTSHSQALAEREQAGIAALEQARVDAKAIVDRAKGEAQAIADKAEAAAKAADELLAAKGQELKETAARHESVKVMLAEAEAKLSSYKEAFTKMFGEQPK